MHIEGGECVICHTTQNLHLHHKVYRSQGGDDSRENLCWLCINCHHDVHAGRVKLV